MNGSVIFQPCIDQEAIQDSATSYFIGGQGTKVFPFEEFVVLGSDVTGRSLEGFDDERFLDAEC